jgi:hypothetical protein
LDGLFQIYHVAVSGVGGYKVSSEDSLHLVEALRYFNFHHFPKAVITTFLVVYNISPYLLIHCLPRLISAWLLRRFRLTMPEEHWS